MWNPAAESTMIDFFAQHRFLWNCKDRDYFKRDLKENTIRQLCIVLGPDYSVTEIKKRWKLLRDSYLRKHKALQAMRHSGAGTDDINRFIKRWEYCHKLVFILDGNAERQSVFNLEVPCSQDTSMAPDLSETAPFSQDTISSQAGPSWTNTLQLVSVTSNTSAGMQPEQFSNSRDTCTTPTCVNEATSPTHPSSQKRKSMAIEPNPRDDLLATATRCLHYPVEDEYDDFGKMVSKILRGFSIKKAAEARLHLMQVLTTYQQTEDN